MLFVVVMVKTTFCCYQLCPIVYCRQERRKAARENAEEATTAAEKNKETEEVAEKKIQILFQSLCELCLCAAF